MPPVTPVNQTQDWIQKDKKHLWHPFTQMREWQEDAVLVIDKGEGCRLYDTEGKSYLDGVSSLWCNVHGHQVPEIDEAIHRQLKKIAHSTFLGLTHIPAIELAEKLVRLAPKGLTRVFYSDSGSAAVEVALKMAFQYWQQTGNPSKKRFIKLAEAYHGDTLGSVSVGGIDLFHKIYKPLLFETFQAPSPHAYRWASTDNPEQVKDEALQAMEKILQAHPGEIAAIVMEPLMQGAAGMLLQPKGFMTGVKQLAEKYQTLLIFDEVATGFGRTGKMFACEHEGVTPDLMAVAKGISGGYLPLAATLATEKIYEGFLGKTEEFKAFFHGHTYTANPLACAAGLASLDLFEKKNRLKETRDRTAELEMGLKKIREIPIVGDVRQAGLMAGIELVKDRRTKESFPAAEKIGVKVIQRARQKGAILRPLGPVIVLMPPLAITRGELAELLEITRESITEESRARGF